MSQNKTRTIGEVAGAAAMTQYQAVQRPTGAVVIGTAGTQQCYGIIQDGVDALGDVKMATSGPTKAVAAAAITKGDQLAMAAAGALDVATTGDLVCAEAEETAAAGAFFDINLFPYKAHVSL